MPRPSIVFVSDLPMPTDDTPSPYWEFRVHGVPDLKNPWVGLRDIGVPEASWIDLLTTVATDAFTSVPGARLPCLLRFEVRKTANAVFPVDIYLLPGLREYLATAP